MGGVYSREALFKIFITEDILKTFFKQNYMKVNNYTTQCKKLVFTIFDII